MGALDTNVLVRFFNDDADDAQAAKQRPAAVAALAERSFVSVTVLLELEWVMRGFYEPPARDISHVLRALASIEHITLEDRDAVLVAIDTFDKGLDFADAMHLARSSRASGFATFDQRLAKRAEGLALAPKLLGQQADPSAQEWFTAKATSIVRRLLGCDFMGLAGGPRP